MKQVFAVIVFGLLFVGCGQEEIFTCTYEVANTCLNIDDKFAGQIKPDYVEKVLYQTHFLFSQYYEVDNYNDLARDNDYYILFKPNQEVSEACGSKLARGCFFPTTDVAWVSIVGEKVSCGSVYFIVAHETIHFLVHHSSIEFLFETHHEPHLFMVWANENIVSIRDTVEYKLLMYTQEMCK